MTHLYPSAHLPSSSSITGAIKRADDSKHSLCLSRRAVSSSVSRSCRSLVASCPGHRASPTRCAPERGSPPRLGTGAADVQRMAEARGDLTSAHLPRTGGVPSRLQRPASSIPSQSAAQSAAMHAQMMSQARQPFAPPVRRSLQPRQQRPTYMLGGARPMEVFTQSALREAPRTEPPKRSPDAHNMFVVPRTAGGQRTRPPRTAGSMRPW